MKKKIWIPLMIVSGLVFIPSSVVLAQHGIDGFEAYIKALEYGLLGLKEYLSFIIELFKLVL